MRIFFTIPACAVRWEAGLRGLEPLAGWASGGVARVGKLGCTGADSNVGRASGPLARSRLGHFGGLNTREKMEKICT